MRTVSSGMGVAGALLLGTVVASAPAAGQEVEAPIVAARDGTAPYRILFDGPPGLLGGQECIELPPGDGVFAGLWVGDEPAFATLREDDPDRGLYRLLPGHQVALRRVAFEAGLRLYEPVGFTQILGTDGATFDFALDAQGDFEINLLGAADRPGRFAGTFQLIDPTGLHADSDAFTLCFETVPAPASIALPVLGWLTVLRRRRGRDERSERPIGACD